MQNKHQREFFIYILQFWFLASLNKKLPKVLINHYQALYSTESAHPLMFTGGWNSLPLFQTFLLHYLPAIISSLIFHLNLVQELTNYRLLFDLINMDLWQKPILRWKQCLKIPLCLGNGEWGGGIKRKVNYVLIYHFTCSTAGTTWAGWWTATARSLAIGSSTESHRFSILTTIALLIRMWSLLSQYYWWFFEINCVCGVFLFWGMNTWRTQNGYGGSG